MYKLVLFFAFVVFACTCEARRFTRCELVRELRRQGFPANQLRDWVCLVESESSSITTQVSRNPNGSRDYGLFQINDRYWCNNGSTPGKDCNVRCSDLITSDITIASNCAKRIYNRHKFLAWNGWRSKCQRSLPDISSC